MLDHNRKYPIGAEVLNNGVHFRVFAPNCQKVEVEIEGCNSIPLQAEGNGYFSQLIKDLKRNSLYKFKLNGGQSYPDPASRFQPVGPFGPSLVIDPTFAWSDNNWSGLTIDDQIIYEMHVGTFTKEGTYEAALKELHELSTLGITCIEMMPINEFPGKFGWGYDGVNLFAPTRLYGTPDDLRRFINEAHRLNIGVILDVVYNHFGPEGNFIHEFSKDYFQKEETEWGKAINFDHPDIRQFFLTNAKVWIDEFHFDGLRIDATQAIFSTTDKHVLEDLRDAVKSFPKNTIIIGENESQKSIIIRPKEEGGYGFDGIWNDDFHHSAIVRLTGKKEAYYKDYSGLAQELLSSIKYGYLYQGQYYSWQKKCRGTPCLDLSHNKFINFIQNHDQVANSLKGDRIDQLTDGASLRCMTALLMLTPGTPLLFQGQEFGATSPFLYFADHEPSINELIFEGRVQFLTQFPHISKAPIPNPSDEKTFLRSKLDFSERKKHSHIYQFHKDLIRLRKTTLSNDFDGSIINQDLLLLRFFSKNNEDLLLIFNFGTDISITPPSDPLLAPCHNTQWNLIWHSESIEYGGQGVSKVIPPFWDISARSALIFKTGVII